MENTLDTLEKYFDRARSIAALKSDNALATALGISRQSLSQMRSGALLPGDALMLKIADLAGENTQVALLQLQVWKSRDSETKKAWQDLTRVFQRSAAAILLAFILIFSALPAHAADRTFAPGDCILWKI